MSRIVSKCTHAFFTKYKNRIHCKKKVEFGSLKLEVFCEYPSEKKSNLLPHHKKGAENMVQGVTLEGGFIHDVNPATGEVFAKVPISSQESGACFAEW